MPTSPAGCCGGRATPTVRRVRWSSTSSTTATSTCSTTTWSLVLAGGYREWTPYTKGERLPQGTLLDLTGHEPRKGVWYGPGSLLRRPASWRHKVELAPDAEGGLMKCWTLLWIGKKERSWGFHCASGWIPWRTHLANHEATGNGCEGKG